MEPAGVPAVIAYRGGDKFAALVPVINELPDDADLSALTLETVLKRFVLSNHTPNALSHICLQTPNPDVMIHMGISVNSRFSSIPDKSCFSFNHPLALSASMRSASRLAPTLFPYRHAKAYRIMEINIRPGRIRSAVSRFQQRNRGEFTDEAKHDSQLMAFLTCQRPEMRQFMLRWYLTNGRDWHICQTVQFVLGRHGGGGEVVGAIGFCAVVNLSKASCKARYHLSLGLSVSAQVYQTYLLPWRSWLSRFEGFYRGVRS